MNPNFNKKRSFKGKSTSTVGHSAASAPRTFSSGGGVGSGEFQSTSRSQVASGGRGHSFGTSSRPFASRSFSGRPSTGPRKFGRPNFKSASRPSFGAPRVGGTRTGYVRSNGGSRGRGNFGAQRIDASRFINKAVVTEETTAHFKPEHKFQDFVIEPTLKAAITAKGYVEPTPIQDRAIPHVLKGEDVVGIANTGTGKTAAFLIPLINKVMLNKKEQVMVIVPTRELAIQIEQEMQSISKGLRIFSVCCVGGAPIGRQISQLKFQYNFIIGTPGRIKDLVDRKMIKLVEFKTLVLDEADRMLDMGFVNEMRAIANAMPADRHTLFFSATLSSEIEKLIKDFLKDPVRISVKTGDTSKNVDQDVVKIERGTNKIDVLQELLKQKEFSKVLIFGRTKHGVEKLSKILTDRGFKAESIHGNKNHSKRQFALNSFKSSKSQVLVATDVAARGLDIADVSHVINFDIPATYEDYVHRIGRTGRGGKKGKALTFIE